MITIHENPDIQIRWIDQFKLGYYILVNESTGEVGEPDLMEQIDADILNIGLREGESQWRWFKVDEKERAS